MDSRTIINTLKYNPSKHQQQPIFDQTHPLHYIKSFSSSHNKTSNTLEDHYHDAEISIFDAQKYFNQNNDDTKYPRPQQNKDSLLPHEPRFSSVSSADGDYGKNFRTRSFHATPTASSEASWNSQTGLLVNPPGSVKVSLSSRDHMNNKISSSSRGNNNKSIFGRKCCCIGQKSVHVKEATTSASVHHLGPTSPPPPPTPTRANNNNNNTNKKKSTKSEKKTLSNRSSTIPLVLSPPERSPDPPRQQRISASGRSFVDGATGGFSFPILKNPTQAAVRPPGGFKGIITKTNGSPLYEDPPRDSLDVYQPTENFIIPPARQNHFNPGSPIARLETTDDDLGSDASSDLFELESFSTQTSLYPMYRRRDSLDEAQTFNARRYNNNNNNNNQYGRQSLDEPPTPSVAATECYAPSEISIDWSVTTAEGYDRASVSNFSISASETGGAAFFRQRGKEEAGGDSGKRKGNGGGGGLLLMSCRHGKAVSVGPQPVKCSPAEGGGRAEVYGVHVGGRPPRSSKTTAGNDHSARLSLAFAAS
ncbi:hypothetical protein CASFOL_019341 [Castilleja foliolosa]|uniref:Protein PHYTOCHROME KINASE SUBSTRATE 4 n=1 Tax=Castilleja foliolosa TaxID=1961234 RepID=A0ABD3D5S1_9LAMI